MYRVVSRYSVVVAVVSAAGAVLVGWPPPAPATTGLEHPWLHAAMPVVFAMQASLVVRAEPRNPIGPILAVVAAVTGVWAVAEAWAVTGYPAASVAFALAVWGWLPAMVVRTPWFCCCSPMGGGRGHAGGSSVSP